MAGTEEYEDLAFIKERFDKVMYLTGDIPITKEQADWSKAQRTRKKQADSVSPTTTDNSSDPYDLPPDARSQNRRSVSAMRSSSSSDKHKLSPSVSAGLAPNQLPVVLRFRGANTFSGLALLDSGCADNWISRRTVRENRIRSDEDHDGGKTYTDVSGNAVQSCGLAKGSWARLGMTVDTCFKIAENPPFDVCFGYKFMLRQSMITFHEHGEPVAALIKGKVHDNRKAAADSTAVQHAEAKTQMRADEIGKYLEWKEKMEKDGWQWDRAKNKYYKLRDGHVIWNSTGFVLDLPD